ncbi:hypothetical protein ABZP36_009521 [Zizania latifolia]
MAATDATAPDGCSAGTRYLRAELEVLRAAPSEEVQARVWDRVYAALAAADFSGEYDGLFGAENPTNRKGRKAAGGGFVGGGWKKPKAPAAAQFLEWCMEERRFWGFHEHCVENSIGVPQMIAELFDQDGTVEYDDDSDDDYDGILKPAFVVDGDLDFESGEPLDSFEYLQRVRWEASQIQRVKVAKIDLSIVRNEQTPYMPEISDIPKCSPDLCASKHWEDTLLLIFLRQGL